MARPQRQSRSTISYNEDHLAQGFEMTDGPPQQVVLEPVRAKRTLALKRASRIQERANAKDRAEAKQLERAISESMNSSFEKTYTRGGLERSSRATNQSRDLRTQPGQVDGGSRNSGPSSALQILVDAASADNGMLVNAETTTSCEDADNAATCPGVRQQEQPEGTAGQPCPQTSPGPEIPSRALGEQTNTTAATPASSNQDSEDEWGGEEVERRESGHEAKEFVPDEKKGPGRKTISSTNSDDGEWSAEEESESDEDEEGDVFADLSDDSEAGHQGGAKKKRRGVKPPAKKPQSQLSRRAAPAVAASKKQGSPRHGKQTCSTSAKEPSVSDTKWQKPATVGQENVLQPRLGKVSVQPVTSYRSPQGQKSSKANDTAISPASTGSQYPRKPLKPVNISTTKTSMAPTTPTTGPPLQFPSSQHRRVLGLSKRFQPPPLHPYLRGT